MNFILMCSEYVGGRELLLLTLAVNGYEKTEIGGGATVNQTHLMEDENEEEMIIKAKNIFKVITS